MFFIVLVYMKKIISILLAAILFTLYGCAQNAAPQSMTAVYLPQSKFQNKSLLHGIVVGQVCGGHETNPMWVSKIDNDGFKQALVKSLQFANLYSSENEKAKYRLDVALGELKQPYVGLDLTVSCKARYVLTEIATSQELYAKDIASTYTAKFGDNLIAGWRLQLANEGAARKNIEKFVADLYSSPLQKT